MDRACARKLTALAKIVIPGGKNEQCYPFFGISFHILSEVLGVRVTHRHQSNIDYILVAIMR